MDFIIANQTQFSSWADFGDFTGAVLILAALGSYIYADLMTGR